MAWLELSILGTHPPCDLVCECAAEKGSSYRCDAIHGSNKTGSHRAFLERGGETDNCPAMKLMSTKRIFKVDLKSGPSLLIRAPVEMPAAPRPAMALPMMKAVEVGATAQRREPTSKIPIAARKTHLIDTAV